MKQPIQHITDKDDKFPISIKAYLKTDTPEKIWASGNTDLLLEQNNASNGDLWTLFCSSKCPGEIILKAHDIAQDLKNRSISTIGGFHSPIEKECLRVLLRGSQPIIICPARSIENMQIKQEWRKPLVENRLLILSIFREKRISEARASKRNLFVAALASKVFIAHAAEGSKTMDFAKTILNWGKPVYTFSSSANEELLKIGVQPLNGGN